MNKKYLDRIFKNYIDKFELLNDSKHCEYAKWQTAKVFRNKMNVAIESSGEDFPKRLLEAKETTRNLIDIQIRPFEGLIKFAEKEPETVREMFRALFNDDGGDMTKRQAKVENFIAQSHALRDKYFPGSFVYNDDMRSVTSYLFYYDPDHNYVFKATNAREFADYVWFCDEWGTGDTVKLDIYYRMCNQLVEIIKANNALLATDASRFENGWGVDPDTLYPDTAKHLLAADLIYCCAPYGLFTGVPGGKMTARERELLREKILKAMALSEKLERANAELQKVEDAREYVNSLFTAGKAVHHTTYGDGVILENNGKNIKVEFSEAGVKRLSAFTVAANALLTVDGTGYNEKLSSYAEYLKMDIFSLQTAVYNAEKDLAPYKRYLE